MLSRFDNAAVYGRLRATLEPDAGLPNRLLELFAARGVLPLAFDFRIDTRRNEAHLRVDAIFEQDTAPLVKDEAAWPRRARCAVGLAAASGGAARVGPTRLRGRTRRLR